MALTLTRVGNEVHSVGNLRATIFEVAFDNSYPTGGEALTAADLGLVTIEFVLFEPAAGYTFEYDHTNSKVIARHGNNDGVADGPSVEVPNTTDLSAVVAVRGIAFGKG